MNEQYEIVYSDEEIIKYKEKYDNVINPIKEKIDIYKFGFITGQITYEQYKRITNRYFEQLYMLVKADIVDAIFSYNEQQKIKSLKKVKLS